MFGILMMLVGMVFFLWVSDLLLLLLGLMLMWMYMYVLMIGVTNWGVLGGIWGVDLYSITLCLLSIWVVMISIMATSKSMKKVGFNLGSFLLVEILILGFLLMSFGSENLLYFYISFEMVLVPMVLLVLGFGGQPEKLSAGLYMLFYTMVGSFPLLLSLLYLGNESFSLSIIWSMVMMSSVNFNFWVFLLLGFMIKLPVYGLHLWLPKAHVEAPVSGSMILAGVLLKLGGYGLLRVMPFIDKELEKFSGYFISVGLLGGLFTSMLCVRQVDMKMLVAYSSVGHMGIMMSGMFSLSNLGLMGALIMMVSHGLTSSGMFMVVNFLYERFHTRMIMLVRGGMVLLPTLMLGWFLLCASNMAAPPFLNLASELLLGMSLVTYSYQVMMVLGLFFFVSAVYNLYLYAAVSHGGMTSMFSIEGVYILEYFLVVMHLWPLLGLVMKLEIF